MRTPTDNINKSLGLPLFGRLIGIPSFVPTEVSLQHIRHEPLAYILHSLLLMCVHHVVMAYDSRSMGGKVEHRPGDIASTATAFWHIKRRTLAELVSRP